MTPKGISKQIFGDECEFIHFSKEFFICENVKFNNVKYVFGKIDYSKGIVGFYKHGFDEVAAKTMAIKVELVEETK